MLLGGDEKKFRHQVGHPTGGPTESSSHSAIDGMRPWRRVSAVLRAHASSLGISIVFYFSAQVDACHLATQTPAGGGVEPQGKAHVAVPVRVTVFPSVPVGNAYVPSVYSVVASGLPSEPSA